MKIWVKNVVENSEYAAFFTMLITSDLMPESCAEQWNTRMHAQILLALARAGSDHGLNYLLRANDVFVWKLKKSRVIILRVGFRVWELSVILYLQCVCGGKQRASHLMWECSGEKRKGKRKKFW